ALVEIEAPALKRVPAAHESDVPGDEERLIGLLAEAELAAELDVRVIASDPGVAIDADLDVERQGVGDVERGRGGRRHGWLLAADDLDRRIRLDARSRRRLEQGGADEEAREGELPAHDGVGERSFDREVAVGCPLVGG